MTDAGHWPTTDRDGWGSNGTTGGDHGSFARRYSGPLARVARRALGVDGDRALDLAHDFVVAQVSREARGRAPVFDMWAPTLGPFRNYLFRAFMNYCIDVRRRESRRPPEVATTPIDEVAEPVHDEEYERWVVREHVAHVRARVLETPPARLGLRAATARDVLHYLELRWPADLDREPPDHAAVIAELGLDPERGRYVREQAARVVVEALRADLHAEGVEPDGDALLRGVARAFLA